MPAKTEKKNESKPVKKNENKVQKEIVKKEEKVQEQVQQEEVAVTVEDDVVVVVKKRTKKAKVEKTGPKKNKSSYMFFCVDEREKIKQERADLNNKEIVVELGARWKTLKESVGDRLKYFEKLAAEDKERYSREKKDTTVESAKDEVKKTKKTKKQSEDTEDVKPDGQKKTKVNGYINFCKENREIVKKNNPNILPKEITKELSVLWKNLSESEKEEYKNK